MLTTTARVVTNNIQRGLDGILQSISWSIEGTSAERLHGSKQGKRAFTAFETASVLVRFDHVVSFIEFLQEHRKVEQQEVTITQQRKDLEAAIAQQQNEIKALTATVKEQAAQIQKVSAQLELQKRSGQAVANTQ